MPFRLVNTLTTVQTIMNQILREYLDYGVVVNLDNILIYSENIEDHFKPVQQGLDRLPQHDLALWLKKSVFHLKEPEFLAYIVKTDGVTISDRKVKSVKIGLSRDRLKKSNLSLDSQTSIDDLSKISRKFVSQSPRH